MKNDGKIFKDLGSKLRGFREKAGITQSEVAKSTGISVNYYARIERGEENPTYEVLHQIKKALKIKSDLV